MTTFDVTRFEYAIDPGMAMWHRVCLLRPERDAVTVSDGMLVATFGPWTVATDIANVAGVTTTGPYRTWRVAGPPRLGWTDRGLTFATNARVGLCIAFIDPVPGIDPIGLINHPTLTVTVSDLDGLAASLGFRPPIEHVDLTHGTILGTAHAVWRHVRRRNTTTVTKKGMVRIARPPGGELVADAQPAAAGVGQLLRRSYRVTVEHSTLDARKLMDLIRSDPNIVTDSNLAPFIKDMGDPAKMAIGDRYTVMTAGPWSGPVQVVDISNRSFRLATLDGHMEAGTIEFRASMKGTTLDFEIESTARPGDRAFQLVYDAIGVGKVLQTEMWVTACSRVSSLAGGPDDPHVEIHETAADDTAGTT